MIPVTQTKVVVKNLAGETVINGNCWAAAIASILELPITEVPNFEVLFPHTERTGVQWMDLTRSFLFYKGFRYEPYDKFKCFHPELIPGWNQEHIMGLRNRLADQYYLVSGPSPRGVNHVTIWQNGRMVHDPHPTREGILDLQLFEVVRPLTDDEKQNPEKYQMTILY